ncbi:UDP-2,4-diacetamido-2,4,6-trideoxy-beta-L-altropyranose hydrolase [Gammaproteobacteria bacterium]|nr:UDP-2,4-diacetamido-2,4,6-trideoxy-beta-L-altropyranose hydrolase [Gammaproteobacteria bacterium]
MKFTFRVDASIKIGSGHLMRCLALASFLRRKGHETFFISRDHVGNMESYLLQKKFKTFLLSSEIGIKMDKARKEITHPEHYHFLEYDWKEDAKDANKVLEKIQTDWLIVDHYALDYRWETLVKENTKKIFVIDDLADRAHASDLLLDQTLGRRKDDYKSLVPKKSEVITGSKYALLRSEFKKHRKKSINNRDFSKVRSILITMGGVDRNNFTNKILEILNSHDFSKDIKVKVIMGKSSPWIGQVKESASKMEYKTDVLTDVENMAELMYKSDLIFGACGSSSWERCCLGIPSINIILEKNQEKIGNALHSLGACVSLSKSSQSSVEIKHAIINLLKSPYSRKKMSRIASGVTDGRGIEHIYKCLMQEVA